MYWLFISGPHKNIKLIELTYRNDTTIY